MVTTGGQDGIKLHLFSGVPVVELSGELNEASVGVLTNTIDRLARAGHLDIIVNFALAIRPASGEKAWLVRFEALTASLMAHYGRIDLVGGTDLMEAARNWRGRSVLRLAQSEEEALCQIKGVQMMSFTPKMRTMLPV